MSDSVFFKDDCQESDGILNTVCERMPSLLIDQCRISTLNTQARLERNWKDPSLEKLICGMIREKGGGGGKNDNNHSEEEKSMDMYTKYFSSGVERVSS